MDRRQRKTRNAIFEAFVFLLSKKSFNRITVGEIIEKADIGRATFYAHFETKDFLLKELCDELFCHLFDCMDNNSHDHIHIFSCDDTDSVYLHLLRHIRQNDNHLCDLLLCSDNALFMSYFKNGLIKVIDSQEEFQDANIKDGLPRDFVLNHIASTFVQTVEWWLKSGVKESPEKIYSYFQSVINKDIIKEVKI